MSLAQKSFSAAIAAPLALAFTLAGGAAHADVAYGCRKPGPEVAALSKQVLEQEGMEPLGTYVSQLKNGQFIRSTLMINRNTGNGVSWDKTDDDQVCIYTKYREANIYPYQTLDQSALWNVKGVDPLSLNINLTLGVTSLDSKQNPMFRAIATTPTNVVAKHPVEYVQYVTAERGTEKGSVLAATFDGKVIGAFTKDLPGKAESPYKYGSKLTPAGDDVIQQRLSRMQSPSGPYALNKN